MPLMSRILSGLLLVAFSTVAHAQQYPSKPIRMVVSIAAGSVTDVIMRAAAAELQPRLGQPLIIENIGGAAGILGGKTCAQAPGDGYTICVIYHSTMSFNPLLFSNLPYNPDDIVPVSRLFLPDRRAVRLLGDQCEYRRRVEGARTVQARRAQLRDARRRFLSRPVPKMAQQPVGRQDRRHSYRGGGPAAQALAANDVQVTRFGVGNFIGVMEAGKVKALAVSSAKRSAVLPNVPTFAEVGWGDYPGQGWWGLAAPKGTPPEIVARLSSEFQKLFSDPEVRRLPGQAGGGGGANHAGRLCGIPQAGSQGRRDADQDRQYQKDRVQGITGGRHAQPPSSARRLGDGAARRTDAARAGAGGQETGPCDRRLPAAAAPMSPRACFPRRCAAPMPRRSWSRTSRAPAPASRSSMSRTPSLMAA